MAWRIGFLVLLVGVAAFLLWAVLSDGPGGPVSTPDKSASGRTSPDVPTGPTAMTPDSHPTGAKSTKAAARSPVVPPKAPPGSTDAKAEKAAGLAISGRVTGPLGGLLDDIEVIARSEADPGIWSEAKTGSDGAYRIGSLPAGLYTVTVRALPRIHWFDELHRFKPEAPKVESPFPAPKRTGIPAGSEDVDLQVRLPAAVLGQVIAADTGKPMPHIGLRVAYLQGGWTSFNAPHPDPEGRFILGFPEAVTFDLTATAGEDYRESTPIRIALAPGEIRQGVVIRLRKGGVLTGRIVHATGKPVRYASVAVTDPKTLAYFGLWSGVLPEDGRYRVKGLPTARARVEVRTVDYLPAVVEDVDLSETGEVVRNITVRDGAGLQVTVRSAEDEPVGNALITIKNEATGKAIGSMSYYRIEGRTLHVGATTRLRTDAQGRFVYPALPPGRYIIGCRYGGEVLDPVTVTLVEGRTTHHTFVLQGGRG